MLTTRCGVLERPVLKVLGAICAAAGFALGFYLMLVTYERKF